MLSIIVKKVFVARLPGTRPLLRIGEEGGEGESV